MAWLTLLSAVACLIAVFFIPSVALGACSLLLGGVLVVMAVMMLLASRIERPAARR